MEMDMELQGAGAFLACRSQFPFPYACRYGVQGKDICT